MKCKKQGYYAKNCKNQSVTLLRNIKRFKGVNKGEEFKGTWEYKLRHFVFCYNNSYPVYKETKYGISYWLQELSLKQFKGIEEEDK